jgi:hypothetical protein
VRKEERKAERKEEEGKKESRLPPGDKMQTKGSCHWQVHVDACCQLTSGRFGQGTFDTWWKWYDQTSWQKWHACIFPLANACRNKVVFS